MMLFIVMLFIVPCFSNELPFHFSKCHIKDSEVNNCVLKALNSLKSYQLAQNPEIQLPSFDPFVIPDVEVTQESTMANYTAKGWNFTIRGLKSFEIKEIKYDPATMIFYGKIEFDPISYEARYVLKGNVVSIPLEGKGNIRVGLGPISATIEIFGKINKHGEIERYNPTGIKIRMVIDDQSMDLDGLFGQNKELARMTNEMLNANSKLIVEAVTPAYEQMFEKVFMKPIQLLAKVILHNDILSGSK